MAAWDSWVVIGLTGVCNSLWLPWRHAPIVSRLDLVGLTNTPKSSLRGDYSLPLSHQMPVRARSITFNVSGEILKDQFVKCDGICGDLVQRQFTVMVQPGRYFCPRCWNKVKKFGKVR